MLSVQCHWQEGQQGQFSPGPQCEGPPNTAELFQIRSGSSFTSQSSFFKRFVSLYCWFQVSLLFCFALMLLMQTSNYCTLCLTKLRDLCSRWLGPCMSYFSIWMKTATGRYVCNVCMHEKEPQKPPEHTSEPQNFLGAYPRPPHTIYSMGPTFYICLGLPQFSRWPWLCASECGCMLQCNMLHSLACLFLHQNDFIFNKQASRLS